GDDFVAIVDPSRSAETAAEIIDIWDRQVKDLYDPEDAERGYIETTDRRNQMSRVPLQTVSVGIASNSMRPIYSHFEAAEIAAEMKNVAKRESRSSYAIDRRRSIETLAESTPQIGPN
ncbi:MAG: diguanylate cyclase, partial [Actinomycetota bacterium]